jgi:predicted nucleic acid-binding protein
MIIFDSNIWIAFFHQSDQTHQKAVAIFKEVGMEKVILTEYVLLETATVLKQRGGHALVLDFLQTVYKSGTVEILSSSFFYEETMILFESLQEKHLSFVDVSLLYLSREYTVLTFDRHLKRLMKK